MHLWYTLFRISQFCIFNVYNFSKNVYNFVSSLYTIFWSVDIFYQNLWEYKVCTLKNYTQFHIINVHNFLNNVHNYIYSVYTFFFSKNVCNLHSNNGDNFLYSMCTFFFKCTQFCIFKVHNFFLYVDIFFTNYLEHKFCTFNNQTFKKYSQSSIFNFRTFKKRTQLFKECTQSYIFC